MKTFVLFLSFIQLLNSTELKHINIGNQDFSMVTESYDIYDSKGTVMKLYKEERNNNLLFVLSLTIKDSTGTCADKSIEEGSYEINATHITLYNVWNRQGKAYDAPKGVRKQIFEVQADYRMKRMSSKLYIETARKNYNKTSGMKYLFKIPKSEKEKEKFASYIKHVEKKFKGTFVFGEELKTLRLEVQNALAIKAKNRWK